jgi:hypothetical protein
MRGNFKMDLNMGKENYSVKKMEVIMRENFKMD